MRIRTMGAKVMIWGAGVVLSDGDVLAVSALCGRVECSQAGCALGFLQGAGSLNFVPSGSQASGQS